MTDGIVQKVFSKYYSLTPPKDYNTRLDRLKQELIEEIKKNQWGDRVLTVTELIGDNE